MDSALSLKYTRTVQQLQKKKDELDQVFEEARKLEADNEALMAENRELKAQNAQLESTAKSSRADLAALEAQVLKQQAKLQQYIEKELKSSPQMKDHTLLPATPSAVSKSTTAHMSAELSEARRQILAQEDARRTALEAAEKYRKGSELLYNEVVSLRNELNAAGKESSKLLGELKAVKKSESALKEAVKKLHERNVDATKEADEIDRIEMKALEGLKAELMVFASENHRLSATIEEERRLHREARAEFEKFESLVRKQRSLSDGHVRVSAEELRNLSYQNDALVEDLRRLTTERDAIRKQLTEAQQRLSQPPTAQHPATSPPSKHPKTPLKGQFEGDAVAATLQQAKQLRETLLKSTAERSTNTIEAQSAAPTSPTIQHQNNLLQKSVLELQLHNDTLRNELRSLQHLMEEKEQTNSLRVEKQALLELELTHANLELTQLKRQRENSPLEQLLNVPPRANSEEAIFMEKLKDLVGSTLLTASRTFKQFQEHPGGIRSTSISSVSSAGDGDEGDFASRADVVPIVPYRKFDDSAMNSIFEQIGGIRHILRRLGKFSGYSADNRKTVAERPRSEPQEQAPLLQAQTARFNLDAWLDERETKAATQGSAATPRPSTHQRHFRTDYRSGESLLDSIEELRRTPAQLGSVKRGV